MKRQQTECPRCEAPQSFPVRYESIEGTGLDREYIRCTMCRYKDTLGISSVEIRTAKKLLASLQRRRDWEIQKNGKPGFSSTQAIERVEKRLEALISQAHGTLNETN